MDDNVFTLSYKSVASVPWNGSVTDFDSAIHALGKNLGHKKFKAINPYFDDKTVLDYVDIVIPDNPVCVVWTYQGKWVVKLFDQDWSPSEGYHSFEIQKPKLAWTKNEDLDRLMTFKNNPVTEYNLKKSDEEYELVWYIDPRVNPLEDKVWAMKARPIGTKIKGVKDMGYVMPDVAVEFNEHLPDIGVDVDLCYPAYYELAHECAYELDKKHQTDNKRLWVVKFTPTWRKPKEWIWLGSIAPEYNITTNPDLPNLEYNVDYIIPWHDLAYEHVWMLSNEHLNAGEPEIWAFKIKAAKDTSETKVIDYVSLEFDLEINPDLPEFNLDLDYIIPWHDLAYEHVWYIKHKNKKVWAAKVTAVDNPIGTKEVGIIIPELDRLDVIFISYHEPNAEENWQRVLAKAPWAKRVDGVSGIFEAHKAAARLSNTDMFYVVDGDAWLVDEWNFNYQPNLFDRDCAYVWSSKNSINDLVYQYGGVKLFNKSVITKKKTWKSLDMFSTMPKIKSENDISCITRFNTDEFATWRSAFRESVKLYVSNQITRLDSWLSSDINAPFGKFAQSGAQAGINFAKENINNLSVLTKINDYTWLKQQFRKENNLG